MPSDYVFDKQQEAFWDLRDGTIHSEKAVNASIPIELWRVQVDEGGDDAEDAVGGDARRRGRPRRRRERLIPPSNDILRVETDQFVEGSTWWPGEPQIIKDIFIDNNGWRTAIGRRIYNKYLPPPTLHGDASQAGPWIEHVKRLWPAPAEHEYFFDYCAHMVQRPDEKCNAAIVLSGAQRIGKDLALLPVRAAIGMWNSKNIDPDELFSPYKPWLETLMLTVDEVRPTKDEFSASSAYNILKPMIAAPPETLPVNDKYTKLRHIINRVRVFITTNDWMSMYIPPEDGRMFIMHSALKTGWQTELGMDDYFVRMFGWCEKNGAADVAAWLLERDLSHFNPKGMVNKTQAWSVISASWGEPEDCVAMALEALGRPTVVFGTELMSKQFDGADEMAGMLKSPRKIAHRMLKAGYVQVPPDSGTRWRFGHNGHKVETRYAFVKSEDVKEKARFRQLVLEKGSEMARIKSGEK